MKKVLFILISLLVASCSDRGNNNSSSQSIPIVGTWSFIYPSLQCTETYTFNSDNTFTASSSDENFGGTYSFSDQANSSNRYALSFVVTSENQQVDCEGNNENDIGLVVNIFAEFANSTTMHWFFQSSGDSPAVTLNKQ